MLLFMQKIAIVIPCYNEEKRLNSEHIHYLVETTSLNIYLANDGSSDNTKILIDQLQDKYTGRCFAVQYQANEGKANTVYKAVNELVQSGQYDYIGYFDADFSTPPSEIVRMVKELETQRYNFIFGSRVKLLNSRINRKPHRHIIGRIIITLINSKLKLGIYDTQCGAKILRTDLAKVAFSEPFYTSWLFDVEVFARLKRKNLLDDAKEFPLVEWKDVEGSKLGYKTAVKIIRELYLLISNY